MKLSKAKTNKKKRPFVKTEELEIVVDDERNKITQFSCTYKGETKVFKVKNFKILDAWKQMQDWLNKKK